MAPPNALPSEVYVEIFQHIHKHDIHKCFTVCKAWSDAAIQTFYRKGLTITSKNVDFLQAALSLDLDSDMDDDNNQQQQQQDHHYRQNFSYGYWVKILEICQYGDSWRKMLEAPQFIRLLSHLPNLTTMDLSQTEQRGCAQYLAILRDVDNKKVLTHIQEIKFGDIFHDYFLTFRPSITIEERRIRADQLYSLYHFRSTLTHLKIYDGDYDRNGTLDGETPLKLIPYFENLTHLIISNAYHTHQLFRVLKSCQCRLISLEINCGYSDSILPHIIHHDEETLLQNLVMESTTFISTLKTNSQQLQHLHIHGPYLTTPYLRYITLCTPYHLTTCKIEMLRTDFSTWLKKCGESTVMELARRLSSVKVVTLLLFQKDRDFTRQFEGRREDELLAVSSEERKSMASVLRFVQLLKGDQRIQCKAHYFNYPEDDQSFCQIDLNSYMKSISLEYASTQLLQTLQSLSLSADIGGGGGGGGGGLEWSVFVGSPSTFVNSLRYTIYPEDYDAHYQELIMNILAYSLNSFPNIKTFYMACFHRQDEAKICRLVVEEENAVVDKNNAQQQVPAGGDDIANLSSSSIANLTRITAMGLFIHQQLIDTFVQYLPNIKTLDVPAYNLIGHIGSIAAVNSDTTWDLRAMKNLTMLHTRIRPWLDWPSRFDDKLFIFLDFAADAATDEQDVANNQFMIETMNLENLNCRSRGEPAGFIPSHNLTPMANNSDLLEATIKLVQDSSQNKTTRTENHIPPAVALLRIICNKIQQVVIHGLDDSIVGQWDFGELV